MTSALARATGFLQRRFRRSFQSSAALVVALLLLFYSAMNLLDYQLSLMDCSTTDSASSVLPLESPDSCQLAEFVTLHSPPSHKFDLDQLCPQVPPFLVGRRNVSRDDITMEELESLFAFGNSPGLIMPGGKYRPKDCQSRHKVAIVVPYRDRSRQLTVFLRHIHPFLQRQQLAYTIFVVEQTHGAELNRGMLKNIGFIEALRQEMYECVIFNDIDLLPEDDRNLYTCPDTPRHLSVIIDIYNYELVATDNFGGVVALSTPHFTLVNGYSNLYWGWGCEDDDLYDRVHYRGLNITRPEPVDLYRYVMLPHKKDQPSPERKKILGRPIALSKYDGLTNLNYRRLQLQFKPLFTHILVDLVQPDDKKH